MNRSTSWQDFTLLYYDYAISSASRHIKEIKASFPKWDDRIDEDAVAVDASIDALQKAFVNYDPTRGASLTTYISRLVHNEVVDKLKAETRSLSTINDITPNQELEYTLGNIAASIPEEVMENLKDKLRAAIDKLLPIDQGILHFFLEDPSTFIEKSSQAFGISPNMVSVRKCRAIAQLPKLMSMTSNDYFDLYEDHQFTGSKYFRCRLSVQKFMNPIYPDFDLENVVLKLYDAITAIKD